MNKVAIPSFHFLLLFACRSAVKPDATDISDGAEHLLAQPLSNGSHGWGSVTQLEWLADSRIAVFDDAKGTLEFLAAEDGQLRKRYNPGNGADELPAGLYFMSDANGKLWLHNWKNRQSHSFVQDGHMIVHRHPLSVISSVHFDELVVGLLHLSASEDDAAHLGSTHPFGLFYKQETAESMHKWRMLGKAGKAVFSQPPDVNMAMHTLVQIKKINGSSFYRIPLLAQGKIEVFDNNANLLSAFGIPGPAAASLEHQLEEEADVADLLMIRDCAADNSGNLHLLLPHSKNGLEKGSGLFVVMFPRRKILRRLLAPNLIRAFTVSRDGQRYVGIETNSHCLVLLNHQGPS